MNINIELLKKKYIDEKKGIKQVADEFGVSSTPIRRLLGELGLRRSVKEGNWIRWRGRVLSIDEAEIRRLYTEEMMSSVEIAKIFGVSVGVPLGILRKAGLVRSRQEIGWVHWHGKIISIDDVEIKQMYSEKRMTTPEIAKELGVSGATIWQKLKRMGVIRSRRETMWFKYHGETTGMDEDVVKQMYTEKEMSIETIARSFDVSNMTIWKILDRMGIIRSHSDANLIGWEPRKLQLDEGLLKEMYVDKEMSFANIAKHFGVCEASISTRLHKMGIGRSWSEMQKKNWRDPEYAKRYFKALSAKPNKRETHIDNMIQEMFPSEFVYNGTFDADFHIDGKIPDWVHINGRKLLIEHNGCYYHACNECGYGEGDMRGMPVEAIKEKDNERLRIFAEAGYKTLVLWEHDPDEVVADKVRQFVEIGG